jgi:hypothetical protein
VGCKPPANSQAVVFVVAVAFAIAVAFLVVIPEGDLLLPLHSPPTKQTSHHQEQLN